MDDIEDAAAHFSMSVCSNIIPLIREKRKHTKWYASVFGKQIRYLPPVVVLLTVVSVALLTVFVSLLL